VTSDWIDRRAFLGGLSIGALLPGLTAQAAAGAEPLYISAKAASDGRFFVSGFDRDGAEAFDLPLPERGHGFTVHPTRAEGVIFARRPGTFALVVGLASGRMRTTIHSVPGRHFYGHGAYTQNGVILFATENDYATGEGVLGLYDARDGYRRIGEYRTYGIDPHDIRLLGDGTTLVVANGGILTHPDAPRAKLNLDSMEPSLVYVDARDGRLLAERRLSRELHQLSIRHLAVNREGAVGIAMQYEGPAGDLVPLVAIDRGRGELALLEADAGVTRRMQNYCGSAALDRTGSALGISCPRGNLVTLWDFASGRFLRAVEVADGCGIAPGPVPLTFVVSSGRGGVYMVDAHTGERRTIAPELDPTDRWDNHLLVAEAPETATTAKT
jgi:uncharacterized protein